MGGRARFRQAIVSGGGGEVDPFPLQLVLSFFRCLVGSRVKCE